MNLTRRHFKVIVARTSEVLQDYFSLAFIHHFKRLEINIAFIQKACNTNADSHTSWVVIK